MMKIYVERHFRTIVEDDENVFDTPEKIYNELVKISEDLGYQYEEEYPDKLGKGTISIRNDLNIIVRYNKTLTNLYVSIGNTSGNVIYNCTKNSADIDDISVSLQTASMICNEIRQKIR